MNQRDTDLMTIYANLNLKTVLWEVQPNHKKYLAGSAYKRIEDYVRSMHSDNYDEFLQQIKE